MKLLLKTKTSPRCQTPKSGWIWVGSEPGNRIVVLSHFIFSTSGKSSGSYLRNIYIQNTWTFMSLRSWKSRFSRFAYNCLVTSWSHWLWSWTPLVVSSALINGHFQYEIPWSWHLNWSKGILSMKFHDHDNCIDQRVFSVWNSMIMTSVLIKGHFQYDIPWSWQLYWLSEISNLKAHGHVICIDILNIFSKYKTRYEFLVLNKLSILNPISLIPNVSVSF